MLDGVSSLFAEVPATLGVLAAAPPDCFLSTPSCLCGTISSLTTPTVTSETLLPLNIGEWDALPEEENTDPASVSDTLGFNLLSLPLNERLLSFVSDHWGVKVLRLGLSSFI